MKKIRIKRVENMNLTKQLVYVTLVALLICLVILGVILPKILLPFYEEALYNYMSQPSKYIGPNTNKMSEDIAFIIITRGGAYYTSNNLNSIIPNLSTNEIIQKATLDKGKLKENGNTYYYLWGETNGQKNLILTDNSKIVDQEKRLLGIIIPTMVSTVAITIILLFTWSQYVLRKIKKIDKKTKAIITKEKVDGKEFIIDDELNDLSSTIDEVSQELQKKEEYKNMMFQNLSHELKTPISVIQSYIEGIEDEVVTKDEALKIIKEETLTLSKQLKTILEINKIDYLKDKKEYINSKTNLKEVIQDLGKKYQKLRPDICFNFKFSKPTSQNEFTGNTEMWKAVIDNILSNFIRYAKSEINIIVENKKIILFNDGQNIDKDILDKIFLPYAKGKDGQTGLGLSIVKKIVNLFNYDVTVKNTDKGVEFVIE